MLLWRGLDWKEAGGLGWRIHDSIDVVRGVLSIEMEGVIQELRLEGAIDRRQRTGIEIQTDCDVTLPTCTGLQGDYRAMESRAFMGNSSRLEGKGCEQDRRHA